MGGILHAIMEDYGERDCEDKGVGRGGMVGPMPLPSKFLEQQKQVRLHYHTMKVS